MTTGDHQPAPPPPGELDPKPARAVRHDRQRTAGGRLVTQDEELSQAAAGLPGSAPPDVEHLSTGFLALIGSIEGPADLAERHDEYILDRMRRRFGDPV